MAVLDASLKSTEDEWMEVEEIWGEVFRRFDPLEPPRSEWRAERTDPAIPRLHARLNRPFEERPRVLFAGTVGAGKTTELQRLVEARAGRDFAVYFDLHQHLSNVVQDPEALNALSPVEVGALLALAVARASLEVIPEQWPKDATGSVVKALRALDPAAGKKTVDIGKTLKALTVVVAPLAGGASVLLAGIGAVLGSTSGWSIRVGGRGPKDEQDPKVRALVDAMSGVLEEVARYTGKRVVVVLDGLDRIRDLDRAKALFVRSQLLARLPCGLVVAAPLVMRHDMSLARATGFEPQPLVNEPVLDHAKPDDEACAGPGVRFFEELFGLRTRDLPSDLVEPGVIQALARASGGQVRAFVRLVREAAGQAYGAGAATMTATHVEEVIDAERRRLEVGLFFEHLEVLRAVMARPEAPPRHQLVDELLRMGRLLSYPNESEWFYPHPLLLRAKLKTG